jgi:hypothetical protein
MKLTLKYGVKKRKKGAMVEYQIDGIEEICLS